MYCQNCGKENPDNGNFCLNCGAPLKKQQATYEMPSTPQSFMSQPTQQPTKKSHKGKGCLIAIIVAIAIFVIAVIFANLVSVNDDQTTTSSNSSVQVKASTKAHSTAETTTEPKTTSAKTFKAACKTIPYKDIARQPTKYMGERVVYTGKIIQIGKDSDNSYYARIDVTKDEYGYYDDTMYVSYELAENEPKFLEDDIVTFYGVCEGDVSYTSIFGEEITIPAVSAKYIELEK